MPIYCSSGETFGEDSSETLFHSVAGGQILANLLQMLLVDLIQLHNPTPEECEHGDLMGNDPRIAAAPARFSNREGCGPNFILNSAVETAKYTKYAKGPGVCELGPLTNWVKIFWCGGRPCHPLLSRGSSGSRFIPTAVSRFIDWK
jgi:hypothetical protein